MKTDETAPGADCEPVRHQVFLTTWVKAAGIVEVPEPIKYCGPGAFPAEGEDGIPKFVTAVAVGGGVSLVFSAWLVQF